MDDEQTKIDQLYGYVKINSWFEPGGAWYSKSLIGMGSKTVYDRDGLIISHSEAPTGVKIYAD